MTPFETLTAAFRSLTKPQLKNLLWHVEQKTHICCGHKQWLLWADGRGGG